MLPGFSLIEMLLVVAIMSVVAGAVMMVFSGGTIEQADRQLIMTDCAAIRDAAMRFQHDMGEPPKFIAELLQSPDPDEAGGGWWWREVQPPARFFSYDPAIRRGWSGPYLAADNTVTSSAETGEDGWKTMTRESGVADSAAGGRLTILASRHSSYPQRFVEDPHRRTRTFVSHYQFDVSDGGEPVVRFVADPLVSPGSEHIICRLALGIEP